jgi:hypothetical protein
MSFEGSEAGSGGLNDNHWRTHLMSAVTAPLEKVQHWIGSLRSDSLSSRTATTATRAEGREANNGAATASYLFGILSPLPFLGVLFGVAALFQGAQGLRYARRHPGVGGVLQCRIGMALGALFSILYLVAILFLLTLLY